VESRRSSTALSGSAISGLQAETREMSGARLGGGCAAAAGCERRQGAGASCGSAPQVRDPFGQVPNQVGGHLLLFLAKLLHLSREVSDIALHSLSRVLDEAHGVCGKLGWGSYVTCNLSYLSGTHSRHHAQILTGWQACKIVPRLNSQEGRFASVACSTCFLPSRYLTAAIS
jgi:hypothetical protein